MMAYWWRRLVCGDRIVLLAQTELLGNNLGITQL
jgi:hypothetical protein